jgi:hypothetical protein
LTPYLAVEPLGWSSLRRRLSTANNSHAFQATPVWKGEESTNAAVE